MEPVRDEFELDPRTEDPSNTVVLTVAAYSNRRVDDIPPLFRSIDPDALNSVVDSIDEGHVSFSYAGYVVTLTAEGAVSVEPADE